MANGYIGKISAIVTASTADLSRKLQGSGKEVGRFANSVQSQIAAASRSAQSSFNGIFTAAQKVERALQAGTSLRNKRGIALIDPGEADRIRRVVSVAEGLNKPADRARRSFEGLSLEVRGALQPALERMQRSVDFVNNRIEVFGRVSPAAFERVERTIRQTTIAISQLSQAQQRLNSLATGNELEFSDPRLAGNLAAAQKAGQQALSLPAQAIATDPQIAGLVQQINRVSELAVTAGAKVKASIGNPGAAAAATKEYDRLNAVLSTLVSRLNKKYQVIVDTTAAQSRLDALRAELDQTLTGRPQNFDQIASEYQRLRGEVEKLGVAQRQAFAAGLGELITLIADADVANLERARTLIEQIGKGLEGINPAAPDRLSAASERLRERAERERKAADDREAELEVSAGQRSNIPVGRQGRARILQQLGGEIDVVERKVRALPDALQSQLGPQVNKLTNEFILLGRAGVGFAAEQAARLAARVREINDALESRGKIGDNFLGAFGGAGEAGLSLGLDDRQLRGIAGEFEFLQSRISGATAEVRGPLVAAMENYRQVAVAAFRDGSIATEEGRLKIAAARGEVVRLGAELTGTRISSFAQQLNRAGDVARGFGSKFGLAIQQAVFGFDDFFSVTGGLDQRLRAAGNNISQLGFVLGGTAGLIGGVLVSVLAQAAVGIFKFNRGSADSAELAKAFNARLETQKKLLQDISSGFGDIAGDIADSAFTQATKQAEQLDTRLASLIKRLKELRDNTATTLDPQLFLLEGRRDTVAKGLQGADSVPLAAARQAALRDAERQVRERQAGAQQSRPIARAAVQDIINQSFGSGASGFQLGDNVDDRQILEILDRRQLELGRTVDSWFATFATPFQQADARRLIAIVEDARRRLETDIAEAIRRLTEGAFSDSVRRFEAATSATSEVIGQAEEAGGATDATRRARRSQESGGQRFRSAVQQFERAVADGREDEAEKAAVLLARIADSAEARSKETRALVEAANASERFLGLLGRFSELNDSILGDVSSAAEQARREAVQAAGTRDAGLSRPDDARNAQSRNERLQRELAQAQERRRDIELRVSQERQRFEQESPNPEVRRLVVEAERARQLAESEQASDSARAQARQRLVGAEDQLRRAFDASPQARQLQAQLDDADRRAGVALGRDALITRGRELSQTDGERAGRELGESVRAINESFNDRVRQVQNADPFADIAAIEADRQAAIAQARDAAFRQAAPAIFGLADQVANAVLQGPSRAALTATDVSTVEGSRELNRLLRGDDASRDQNLVELQKQSQALDELVRIAREGGVPVANN
jgi:hypothetical protein